MTQRARSTSGLPRGDGATTPAGNVAASSGAAASSAFAGSGCFGPRAAAIKVTPRRGDGGSIKLQKPHTGMTIRLTPELLAQLRKPGPRPDVELVLKSVAEGGPVLIVGGLPHNTNAHQMAVGSDVHIVAKTTPAVRADGEAPADEGRSPAAPGISIFASLHRKLIVQQVLTKAKRAEIRARKDEIDRLEKEAKKTMVRMEDQDEMLAAAGSIPVPARQEFQEHGDGGGGGRATERNDRKRARSTLSTGGGGDEEGKGCRFGERDPLTAWVYDCYNHDDYTGHVSDLRHFLKGIDFYHVMFRYHVKPDGTLDPDRRRFCIKFKTKAGRDLAVGRSGEGLGASGPWSPASVSVVRGRNEDAAEDKSLSDFLMVLPQGRSVAEVLETVKTRLPEDLTPAVCGADHTNASDENGRGHPGQRRGQQSALSTSTDSSNSTDRTRVKAKRQRLEGYRRDMLRAALGATLAEAGCLGAERGAPGARVVGTDEDNARRVATLAADEAIKELDARTEAAGRGWVHGSRTRYHVPSGPAGGARAQQRAALERAK